jgi:hypothetical protein
MTTLGFQGSRPCHKAGLSFHGEFVRKYCAQGSYLNIFCYIGCSLVII